MLGESPPPTKETTAPFGIHLLEIIFAVARGSGGPPRPKSSLRGLVAFAPCAARAGARAQAHVRDLSRCVVSVVRANIATFAEICALLENSP